MFYRKRLNLPIWSTKKDSDWQYLELQWQDDSSVLCWMENQAFQFLIIQTKDEQHCRNCQQECHEDYLQNGDHL
jgi:hypothetical protein